MLINGPDIEKMAPPNAEWYLIAGDMTAQPAAMCNLEILPTTQKGMRFLRSPLTRIGST
ncbi:hypothetical protein [uncultured Ruegeria sp.]|uniref:hypothetical protein n=1 Tax=uncultured Ruegeria sp. TaxID=259304 RepID=UPI002625BAFF|nr:hypothetical protein [uncultured Ruegeria sp.]